MKRILLVVSAALILVAAGCDLFGMEDTRVYVWGNIYEDDLHTVPAQGIGVYVYGDTANVYCYDDFTNADGRFFIEAQIYPNMGGDEEGGFGYNMNENAMFGVEAHHSGDYYMYFDIKNDPLIMEIGDTVRVEDVDLLDFKVH
ncbi:hypothetical protein GF402_04565 [Candidatus Fermentibacteria bacterium]|nr:hypothetical protein [Candidatus Fermentibacteria bacterium]